MRRTLQILLVVLGLGVLAWLVWRASTRSAVQALPQVRPDASEPHANDPPQLIEAGSARISAEPETIEDPATEQPDRVVAQGDPTEAELDAFARVCPPGTIEGIVLRGRTPVAGGWAWLGAESNGGLPWGSPDTWESDANVSRTAIGADGVFRFEALRPDDYGVGVRTSDGATRHVYVTLQPEAQSTRIRIVLGTSGILGHVYDEHGGVCAGWEVGLNNLGNTLAGVQQIDGRKTDSKGSFEFDGLIGGYYMLTAFPDVGAAPPQRRTLFVELQAGQWKTVDFGSRQGGCLWTGRVLSPRGVPMVLMALTELRIVSGDIRENAVLTNGNFQIRLDAGTYDLSLYTYAGVTGPISLGRVTLRDDHLEQDVTLPRTLLRVRPTYRGTRLEPKDALVSLSARLELASTGSKLSSVRDEHGDECFFSVPPGEHTLWCTLPIQGAPRGRVPVTIRETDDEVELDVLVGDS